MIEGLVRAVGFGVLVFILGEVAKRSSYVAAIAASCPIATIAASYLLFVENQSTQTIAEFVTKTTLLLPPSLIFFIGFPIALKKGIALSIAMPLSILLMTLGYLLYIFILKKFGIHLR